MSHLRDLSRKWSSSYECAVYIYVPVRGIPNTNDDLDLWNDMPDVIGASVFGLREASIFFEMKPVVIFPQDRCACLPCLK